MNRPIDHCYAVIPDRFFAGEYPGARDPAQARQKVEAMVRSGVTAFLDLTESDDPLEPYAQWLPAHVVHERHPIQDVSIPSHHSRTVGVLASIDRHLADGRTVYLHCWGGVGRTGLVVGCWLSSRQGLHGDRALEHLAHLWRQCPKSHRLPRSPETKDQREYVQSWHVTEAELARQASGGAGRA